MSGDLTIRRAGPEDVTALLDLLRASMGRADDDRFEALYRWKHFDNAFGPSPAWVATDGDRIVGLRVFMRWRFVRDGRTVDAVRAVDTATHPDYQGRGLFTRLTLDALPELAGEGVGFVFNTPNAQSRPGYLKMGWHVVGRLPVHVRPRSLLRAPKMVQARAAASHWSEPATFGDGVQEVLGDPAVDDLLASRSPTAILRTDVTRAFLGWRYGTPLLAYRAVVAPGGVGRGVVLGRVRRRGEARELVVAQVLVPDDDRRLRARALRAFRRAAGRSADYAIAIGAEPGLLPLPRQGPLLTARAVRSGPEDRPPSALRDIALTLGDIELF